MTGGKNRAASKVGVDSIPCSLLTDDAMKSRWRSSVAPTPAPASPIAAPWLANVNCTRKPQSILVEETASTQHYKFKLDKISLKILCFFRCGSITYQFFAE